MDRCGPRLGAGIGRTLALACACALASGSARAELRLEEVVPAGELRAPLFVTHAGDARLFIVEQGGRIRILDRGSGKLLPGAFLDVASVIAAGGERGLLSLAFHPDYAKNGLFYVNYTDRKGDTVVERYRVSEDRNRADPASAARLLRIDQPFPNHNGGQLQIHPRSGYLYVGMGDGGSRGDPRCVAQRRDSLLGKMLRLDVRQNLERAPFYGIPPDNPFAGPRDPANRVPDEVWSFGLRNPWRFSFDRASGDLYIGDVGQNAYEEIDLERAPSAGGLNFGWKPMEGRHCFRSGACPGETPACNDPALTLPIHEYPQRQSPSAPRECSVTGGYVYRGSRAPELAGRYVFGDYCSGTIRALRESAPGKFESEVLLQAGFGLKSFGEDAGGGLYAVVRDRVYEIVSVPPGPAAGAREIRD
jgi:hypothetical protein